MNAITIFLRGNKDHLNGVLDESHKNVQEYGKKVQETLRTLFATYVTSRVISGMKNAFQTFAESEIGDIKLDKAIGAAGLSADVTRPKIVALSNRIQELTRFDDDAAKAASKLALNMGVLDDQLDSTVKLAADLAEHMGSDLS